MKTNLGLTNQNYITLIDNELKIIRIPYKNNYAHMDYEQEKKIIDILNQTDICLPTDHLDVKSGVKISPFISDLIHLDKHPNIKQALSQIAMKLKQLHSIYLDLKVFNIKEKYTIYKAASESLLFDTTHYEYLLNKLDHYSTTCFCHNDLVNGNLVFKQDTCYLIDFEYAGLNHPYFDLLSVLTENTIEDEYLITHFLEAYFERKLTDQEITDCQFFEKIHHLLWCQWAQMQYKHLQDPIYKEIAEMKYELLISESKIKPHFNL